MAPYKKSGQIHFFYTIVDEIMQNQKLINYYQSIISKSDRQKIDRFVFQKDKNTCLATRALVRFVLSRYSNIPPADLDFIENLYGKPELKQGPDESPVFFNVSHSGRITACAVLSGQEIGIDIEDVNRKVNLSIADRFFSGKESLYLKSRRDHLKAETFLNLWTLKEAYIKARGMGLSIPLNKFSFEINGGNTSVHFHESLNDDPANWTFFRFSLGKLFKAAVAVNASGDYNRKITIYKCIPFSIIKKHEHIGQDSPSNF